MCDQLLRYRRAEKPSLHNISLNIALEMKRGTLSFDLLKVSLFIGFHFCSNKSINAPSVYLSSDDHKDREVCVLSVPDYRIFLMICARIRLLSHSMSLQAFV